MKTQKTAMKDLQGYFKESEIVSFFAGIKNQRDLLLFRMLYKSGRRVSEILCLKVNDIDWIQGMISYQILKKKDKEYRALKLVDQKTLNILEKYIKDYELGENDYLFPQEKRRDTNSKGEKSIKICPHLSRCTAYYLTKKYAEKAGILKVGNKPPHPHCFRHTFAVRMAQKMTNPADMRKLQMWLEHADMAVTQTYLQFNQEDMRSIIESEDVI